MTNKHHYRFASAIAVAILCMATPQSASANSFKEKIRIDRAAHQFGKSLKHAWSKKVYVDTNVSVAAPKMGRLVIAGDRSKLTSLAWTDGDDSFVAEIVPKAKGPGLGLSIAISGGLKRFLEKQKDWAEKKAEAALKRNGITIEGVRDPEELDR